MHHHPYTLESSQSLSIPVKIIIALYKRLLDAHGLKSCEQNDSLLKRSMYPSDYCI